MFKRHGSAEPQVFYDRVLEHTEAGAAAAGDAIVTFEGVAVLYPRGRFDIEMYATFLKLLGQACPPHACSASCPVLVGLTVASYIPCHLLERRLRCWDLRCVGADLILCAAALACQARPLEARACGSDRGGVHVATCWQSAFCLVHARHMPACRRKNNVFRSCLCADEVVLLASKVHAC